MDKETKSTLSAFSQKAMQRLRDRKIPKKRKLFIPSLDQEITIRNLNFDEINECINVDDSSDSNRSDKYSVYLAVVEPDLKKTATELKETGEINDYLEVTDIFEMSELTDIATEIMKLSGAIGSKKVAVVEELKNS